MSTKRSAAQCEGVCSKAKLNPQNALRGHDLYDTIKQTQCEEGAMDTAKVIKELRESTNMNRKEFSEHTGIPVRTLDDWEAGRRTPPEYIPRLLSYQLKYEELIRGGDYADNK